MRGAIRDQFEQHRHIQDLKVIDVLLLKGLQEYQETLNCWKQVRSKTSQPAGCIFRFQLLASLTSNHLITTSGTTYNGNTSGSKGKAPRDIYAEIPGCTSKFPIGVNSTRTLTLKLHLRNIGTGRRGHHSPAQSVPRIKMTLHRVATEPPVLATSFQCSVYEFFKPHSTSCPPSPVRFHTPASLW